MESIIHADIFFFITTIAVIAFTVIFGICGIYLIQAFRNFRDISRKLKRGVDNIEENLEEAYHDLEESAIFRFIFGKRHHAAATKKKKVPKK